jgi:hypothetical protein
MANLNTVSALFGPGTGRFQINALTLAATTETLVVMGTDAGTTTPATIVVPVGNTGNTLVGSGSPIEFNQSGAVSSQSYGRKVGVFTEPPYFSATTFDSGRPFLLRAAGVVTVNKTTVTTVTNSFSISLYNGAAITATYKIATLAAGLSNSSTTANVTGQFYLEALVQWDSTTQTLSGIYDGNLGNTTTTQTALSNAVAVTTASKLIFTPTVTFGHAEGGVATIVEFAVDQI